MAKRPVFRVTRPGSQIRRNRSRSSIVNVHVLGGGPACEDPVLDKLCDILEALQMPVGIELGSIEVGCIIDAEGVVTGKVYMCIVKDEQNTTTTTELKAVNYADGSIIAPYTGPISPCAGNCPDEAPLGVITDLSQL